MQVSYKFKKVFINLFAALLCSAFFSAYAKPITGAFGVKLGSPLWDYELEKDSLGLGLWHKLDKFDSDFFDGVFLYSLPHSKKITKISVERRSCRKLEKQALIDSIENLYSEHDVVKTKKGFDSHYDYLIRDKNERYIGIYCSDTDEPWMFIDYFDKNLQSQYSIEQQDNLKKQINRSNL